MKKCCLNCVNYDCCGMVEMIKNGYKSEFMSSYGRFSVMDGLPKNPMTVMACEKYTPTPTKGREVVKIIEMFQWLDWQEEYELKHFPIDKKVQVYFDLDKLGERENVAVSNKNIKKPKRDPRFDIFYVTYYAYAP